VKVSSQIREKAQNLWNNKGKGFVAHVVARIQHYLARPYEVFHKICFSIGFFVLCTLFVALIYVQHFFSTLPNVSKMSFSDLQTMASKVVQSRKENKFLKYRWVSLRDVSRSLIYSVVLSEDATFFEHDGFNLEAVLNALAENLRKKETAYGASTLSQQVAKNLFLDNEKTLSRKIKEFFITRDLEKRFSKNEILEIYLNIAEFGPDLFGVEAASRHFFARKPKDVNAAEGVFIALMLPSPRRNYFSIYQNQNLTRQKRKHVERVLRDMLYEEYITEAQYRSFVRYNFFDPDRGRLPAGR